MNDKEFLELWMEEDGEFATDAVKLVERGDWVSEGKDEFRTNTYHHAPSDKFFSVFENRRGSYWSDYEFGDPSCCEVKPVAVTRIEYQVVQ